MSVTNNSCSGHYISFTTAHSAVSNTLCCAVMQYKLCNSVRLFDGFVRKWNSLTSQPSPLTITPSCSKYTFILQSPHSIPYTITRMLTGPAFELPSTVTLDHTPAIHNTIDLDKVIASFTHAVRQAATAAIPVHAPHRNHLTFPPILIYLWRLKNYYRRRYQRTHLPSSYRFYCLFTRIFFIIPHSPL
jgi:hypothetical protein